MDSRLMYKATEHLSSVVTYEKDWIHFGTEDQIKIALIEKLIETHLNSKEVLFINERTNSQLCRRNEILEIIKPFLGKKNFQVWTLSMDKVIRFNKHGILLLGQKA